MSGLTAITESKKVGEVNYISFWPSITVAELHKDYRLYSAITDEQSLKALEIAYITVTDALDEYAEAKEREGIAKLEELPSERERSRQVRLFKEAVYSLAKQKINEEYIDVDLARKPGQDVKAATNDSTLTLNANYNMAIRRFLGQSASLVALV
ncbi:head completion/stabilization protein [Ignatzschineria rhizosphaerae]|uniref:Head completion/stabilization protein n=1 Tax=Ignatzschineria rhizosphaerae TaxID=2923279 RepID=A0ABY3WY14_9GAMM|nr:head completion/stabilization protein [Ignatzschineria rhizosphaerae]UNM95501.1 head completion/stabilization protein [Ignatzschineria rhizosphaerae]UNM96083.1 head completion/stabilization protein [Ignatzschineria rhizosphaerae]